MNHRTFFITSNCFTRSEFNGEWVNSVQELIVSVKQVVLNALGTHTHSLAASTNRCSFLHFTSQGLHSYSYLICFGKQRKTANGYIPTDRTSLWLKMKNKIDKVKNDTLMGMLERIGVHMVEHHIIKNLYQQQTAIIEIYNIALRL